MAIRALLALALCATMSVGTANAQSYPSRQITLIVPFAAGGPLDAYSRILADYMRASLGQPVIVENVVGASGTVGVGRAVRAAPDGYTLSMGNIGSHVINGAIYALKYDLLQDLAPIARLTESPQMIISKKGVPAENLQQLIDWLKANPGKATAGTGGVGSPQHLGALLFQRATGTQFGFVPYRGAAPAMQDMVAGHIDIMIDPPANTLPQLKAGTIKVYAVAANTRFAPAPEIPTVDEAGLPGYYYSAWSGIWAPKGTPTAIVDKLSDVVMKGLADPAVRKRFQDIGQAIPPREQQMPAGFGAFHKAEIQRLWPIIKAAGIKPN